MLAMYFPISKSIMLVICIEYYCYHHLMVTLVTKLSFDHGHTNKQWIVFQVYNTLQSVYLRGSKQLADESTKNLWCQHCKAKEMHRVGSNEESTPILEQVKSIFEATLRDLLEAEGVP